MEHEGARGRRTGTRRRVALAGFIGGLAILGGAPAATGAQQAPLYDPQPPATAAYVRVLAVPGAATYEVRVAGRARATGIASGTPSPYLILAPGRHELVIRAGTREHRATVTSVASRSFTVLLAGPDDTPRVIEERINGNRLKAILYAFNLGARDTVDLWTADAALRVFDDLPPSGHASLVVNPIALEFAVTGAHATAPLATDRVEMTAGGAYTIIVSDGPGRTHRVRVVPNTVERYRP